MLPLIIASERGVVLRAKALFCFLFGADCSERVTALFSCGDTLAPNLAKADWGSPSVPRRFFADKRSGVTSFGGGYQEGLGSPEMRFSEWYGARIQRVHLPLKREGFFVPLFQPKEIYLTGIVDGDNGSL
ncbi:hypothetical protein Rs2_15885 [Raphanus sativus]|nr:hypothetical protein Rs2_15885 [Raphanus sativus]